MMKSPASPPRFVSTLALLFVFGAVASAGELLVGSATVDITPPEPVALAGQFSTRISTKAETPIVAAALVIETQEAGKQLDLAIMISCDLVAIRPSIQDKTRQKLAALVPGIDVRKLFLSATHTHTAPVTTELEASPNLYDIPKEGVMQPPAYVEFLTDRLAEAAATAWKQRQPGGVSWTLSHAVVGLNRRAVYADGHAQMYGKTGQSNFRNIEGGEDHAVETLFFWDAAKKLRAVAINLACPAQEVESRSSINADYWHEVREQLKAKLELPELNVLGWCSAAGDQSPHRMYRKEAEERMLKARGLTMLQEIGRRITTAVADTVDIARADIRTDAPFSHTVADLTLPPRKIIPREYEDSKKILAEFSVIQNPDNRVRMMMDREKAVISRFEEGDKLPPYSMELHVLRIGDIAIATNPFELYLDYGVQMKARSVAEQTFLIQLAGGSGKYLPTPKAIEGGSYSALPVSNAVGPEGGQVLVNETVQAISALWPAKPQPGTK
ncbi:hypothetical protein [Prosthecobacter sp.]|uniref:hypothetical protein n=1 Tax=Prosthecobacter sp. TaxID=1965333 RepID=UPI00248728FD|nr:hypothetical protein [Prosthecobacter sp.]MDI1314545.1 hypothetical protein [Prosthecobacter sp.]